MFRNRLTAMMVVVFAPIALAQTTSAEREPSVVTVEQNWLTVAAGSPAPQAEVSGRTGTGFQRCQRRGCGEASAQPADPQHIGDRNAIVARVRPERCRAHGTGHADGLLLSNLLGNSYAYPPRWNIVGTEEIESINVPYGPIRRPCPATRPAQRS